MKKSFTGTIGFVPQVGTRAKVKLDQVDVDTGLMRSGHKKFLTPLITKVVEKPGYVIVYTRTNVYVLRLI